jgi:hypothetical protein
MKRFVEGKDHLQATLLPDCLDDYVTEDNPVRVIDVFIGELVWEPWALPALCRKRPGGLPIIPRRC